MMKVSVRLTYAKFHLMTCFCESTGNSARRAKITNISSDRFKVLAASVAGIDKHVDVAFGDGNTYRFHTAWIKDSSPKNVKLKRMSIGII